MGAVVAGPSHGIGGPGCAGNCARRVDAFVAVHRGVGDGGKGGGVFHDAAKEVAAAVGQAQFLAVIGKRVLFTVQIPDRDMGVATRPRQPLERFWHEGRAQPVLFGDGPHHEFEEAVLVGGLQGVIVFPVHLKLANRVFVVVLVGFPAQCQHVIADLGDDIITAHDGLLIVAGFDGVIISVRYGGAFGIEQEKFRLHPGFDAQAFFCGLIHQFAQHVAGGLIDRLAFHHAVRGEPCHFGLPRQLDDRRRIWHGHHIRMGGGEVQPSGETCKTGTIHRHVVDGLRGNQFGALATEQIGVGYHEVFDAFFLGVFGQILNHFG